MPFNHIEEHMRSAMDITPLVSGLTYQMSPLKFIRNMYNVPSYFAVSSFFDTQSHYIIQAWLKFLSSNDSPASGT